MTANRVSMTANKVYMRANRPDMPLRRLFEKAI